MHLQIDTTVDWSQGGDTKQQLLAGAGIQDQEGHDRKDVDRQTEQDSDIFWAGSVSRH